MKFEKYPDGKLNKNPVLSRREFLSKSLKSFLILWLSSIFSGCLDGWGREKKDKLGAVNNFLIHEIGHAHKTADIIDIELYKLYEKNLNIRCARDSVNSPEELENF